MQSMVKLSDMNELGVLNVPVWNEAMVKIGNMDRFKKLIHRNGISGIAKEPKVELMSMHQSKGKEADHVFVVPDMAWATYRSLRSVNGSDEEHRTMYVASTRAREGLVLLWNKTPNFYEV